MTTDDLAKKYADLPVDEERIEKNFRHLGRFGRTTVYELSFETENSTVTAEVCVKGGKFSGFNPEKEPREDEWGFGEAEPYQEEFTPEECARLDLYLASVLA
jgi:hypothetical protein